MIFRYLVLVSLQFFVLEIAAQGNVIIPKPAIFKAKTGVFKLDKSVSIAAETAGADFAKLLKSTLFEQTGLDLPIKIDATNSAPGERIILIKYNAALEANTDHDLAAEGYFLKISPDTILIDAPRRTGLFYALQTLRQLIGFDRKASFSIACSDMADAPGFDYRGVMLDCGRHFLPFDYLKKQVDLLAFYKINVLRLHLTEDQGWRIEIKKHPELTRHAAWRTEADGSRHGGFYTQDELRELVAYAAARNVEIIPEIEMPGHCAAALSAFPNLSCRRESMPVPHNWGVFKDVFCAGNDSVFLFLQDVLTETMQVFPSKYIHIGGDEVPKDRWHECPRCQNRLRAEGLKNEHELQAYFIRRIRQFVESRGRTLIGWDEILEGGVDKSAVVEVWREMSFANQAVKNGNKIILAPSGHYYLNRPPGDLPLENVYRFDPLADSVLLANAGQILGIEAPLWTEHISELNADNMLYPRLLAISETAWTGGGDSNFTTFKNRLQRHYPMLDSLGADYGPESKNILDYDLKFRPEQRDWILRTEKGLPDLEFRYLAESDDMKDFGFNLEKPLFPARPIFSDSLVIKKPGRLKMAPFRNGRQYASEVFFTIKDHFALGQEVMFDPKYDERYPKAGDLGLTDGIIGSLHFNDGAWLGWQGPDLDATLIFDQVTDVKKVSVNFFQQSKSWILLPTSIEFYTSENGDDWLLSWVNEFNVNALDERSFIETSEWEVPKDTRFKWLRVVAKNFGKLPVGHNGAGGDAWIFADEIVVEK